MQISRVIGALLTAVESEGSAANAGLIEFFSTLSCNDVYVFHTINNE